MSTEIFQGILFFVTLSLKVQIVITAFIVLIALVKLFDGLIRYLWRKIRR